MSQSTRLTATTPLRRPTASKLATRASATQVSRLDTSLTSAGYCYTRETAPTRRDGIRGFRDPRRSSNGAVEGNDNGHGPASSLTAWPVLTDGCEARWGKNRSASGFRDKYIYIYKSGTRPPCESKRRVVFQGCSGLPVLI
jgi:hypothetical protein